MRRYLVFFLFCSINFLSQAQNSRRPIIVNTTDCSDYYYIPASALADSVQGIVFDPMFERKTNINNRAINLYWNSICIDGTYNICITPRQLFFYSSHNNPNPSVLFWLLDIDSTVYRQINIGIRKKTPPGFVRAPENNAQPQLAFYYKSFADQPLPKYLEEDK